MNGYLRMLKLLEFISSNLMENRRVYAENIDEFLSLKTDEFSVTLHSNRKRKLYSLAPCTNHNFDYYIRY